MTPLAISTLFEDGSAQFLSRLKSQRFGLKIDSAEDYSRALTYVVAMGVVGQFQRTCVAPVLETVADRKAQGMPDEQIHQEAWQLFAELVTKAAPTVAEGVDMLISKGLVDVCTHHDRSSEIPQDWSARERFMPQMAKQFGRKADDVFSHSASMLLAEHLPVGVTMSAQRQAELGIVCSSTRGFATSAGNAATAPMQQAFLIQMLDDERQFSLLDLLLRPDAALNAKLCGMKKGAAQSLAAMAMQVQQGANVMADIWMGCLETVLHAEPDVLALNVAKGKGIHLVRLPMPDGSYRVITPLLNAGLLKDIHQASFIPPSEEAAGQWRRLFSKVYVGGSKPQNAGTLFSSVISKGRVNALHAGIYPQHDLYRWVRLRIESGKPLFRVERDDVISMAARKALVNPDAYSQPLHLGARRALALRVRGFVAQVERFLASMSDAVFDCGVLFAGARHDLSVAGAEMALLTGRADSSAVLKYATYLQRGIFSHCALTNAEKVVVANTLRSELFALKERL